MITNLRMDFFGPLVSIVSRADNTLLMTHVGVDVVPHGGDGHEPPPEALREGPGGVDPDADRPVPVEARHVPSQLRLADVDQAGEAQDAHNCGENCHDTQL